MTDVDLEALRAHLVERAAAFQLELTSEQVEPELLPGAVPGLTPFRAQLGSGRTARSLGGVVSDDGAIDSGPVSALAKVFLAWEAHGGIPDANTAARVVAFLRGKGSRSAIVHGPADLADLALDRHADLVAPPKLIEVGGHQGVEFWWFTPMGLRRNRTVLGSDGRVQLDEQPPGAD